MEQKMQIEIEFMREVNAIAEGINRWLDLHPDVEERVRAELSAIEQTDVDTWVEASGEIEERFFYTMDAGTWLSLSDNYFDTWQSAFWTVFKPFWLK